jgi:hypothetical protein
LRFSRSGNPNIEAAYRTHWVSPKLSEKKRERLAEKASRAPDPVSSDAPDGLLGANRDPQFRRDPRCGVGDRHRATACARAAL